LLLLLLLLLLMLLQLQEGDDDSCKRESPLKKFCAVLGARVCVLAVRFQTDMMVRPNACMLFNCVSSTIHL
jgi:hypothetical protein